MRGFSISPGAGQARPPAGSAESTARPAGVLGPPQASPSASFTWLSWHPRLLPKVRSLALRCFQVGLGLRVRASISLWACTPVQRCVLCVLRPPTPPPEVPLPFLVSRDPKGLHPTPVFNLRARGAAAGMRSVSRPEAPLPPPSLLSSRDPGDLCFSFSKSSLSPGLALDEIICKICSRLARAPSLCHLQLPAPGSWASSGLASGFWVWKQVLCG